MMAKILILIKFCRLCRKIYQSRCDHIKILIRMRHHILRKRSSSMKILQINWSARVTFWTSLHLHLIRFVLVCSLILLWLLRFFFYFFIFQFSCKFTNWLIASVFLFFHRDFFFSQLGHVRFIPFFKHVINCVSCHFPHGNLLFIYLFLIGKLHMHLVGFERVAHPPFHCYGRTKCQLR